MSDAATQAPDQEAHAEAHGEAHGHPMPREYVNVAVVLAIITAAEVASSYVALPRLLFVGGLTAMAVAKFAIVVGWYMHLKFDNRMFRRMFVFGLVLAVTVFLLVLGLFILSPSDAAN